MCIKPVFNPVENAGGKWQKNCPKSKSGALFFYLSLKSQTAILTKKVVKIDIETPFSFIFNNKCVGGDFLWGACKISLQQQQKNCVLQKHITAWSPRHKTFRHRIKMHEFESQSMFAVPISIGNKASKETSRHSAWLLSNISPPFFQRVILLTEAIRVAARG